MLKTVRAMMEAVKNKPDNWHTRLVYADALEESGNEKQAASERRKAKAIAFPGGVILTGYQQRKIRVHAGGEYLPVRIKEGGVPPSCWALIMENAKNNDWAYYPVGPQRLLGAFAQRIVRKSLHVQVGIIWLLNEDYIK